MVYVGAVMVLFLFVVMMLDVNVEKLRAGLHATTLPLGALIARASWWREIGVVIWVRGLGLGETRGAGAEARRATRNTARTRPAALHRVRCIRSRSPAVILLVGDRGRDHADHAPAARARSCRTSRKQVGGAAPRTACGSCKMDAEGEQ
ncbi:MAG: NADH-quinone oxidoreductase subunit J [Chromatiales bacterium]|nr:NADH-quinone oxidoreductase subunit J [Chromatiales bacterium]